ncbi:MAG: hypothetical protein GXP18_12170 [Gammaproteobacteria bacterium]|nr:hypothetical protein [Gammaproteobacteria bacterium]
MNRLSDFYRLGAALTDYEIVQLEGTGVGEEYYDVLTSLVSGNILDELFDDYNNLDKTCSGHVPDEQIRSSILANPKLGPVARNIIKLWYLSIWYQLPENWRQKYGIPNQTKNKYQDVQFIVSRNAYIQGLVWQATGSHPMGAKQPGYGTWSAAPGNQPHPVNFQ